MESPSLSMNICDSKTANVGLCASKDENLRPMASSSTGKGIADSGEQCSHWASNVEHTLRIMREEMHGKVDVEFRILKVPEYFRRPTAEFTPALWRFGLHNRDENLDMSETEFAKRAVVVLLGLDEQRKWISFCDAVVPDPRAMLKCYGLHIEVNALFEDKVKQKQMLAFDALFLAFLIDYNLGDPILFTTLHVKSERAWNYFLSSFESWMDLARHDFCLTENQIPFDLIKSAIKHVQTLTGPRQENGDHAICIDREAGQVPDSYLESWMKAAVKLAVDPFMYVADDFYEGANANQMLLECQHILDAAHKVICGEDGMKWESDESQKDYIHVPSATRLKESGITIVGVAGPLSAMAYDKKMRCLFLPKMRIFDRTVCVVRNMARHEQFSSGNRCMLHDYVMLMLDLIETPLDLKHLIECGVVHNECGNKGVDMWRALDDGLTCIWSSKEHNQRKRDINERCKLRRYRFWSEFRTLFLSRPWLTLSTIVVTLVTVATLIQTYVAIISSNRMKPQFNP